MKKIIITGAPRTGTTALAELLSHTPKILVTSELGVFDHNYNHYLERSKRWFEIDKNTKNILAIKNLTEKEVNEFVSGNYTNKGELEFFGDKWPTYCVDRTYCDHLVKNHPDAYFIFTYRNPFATIYSGIYRSKLQEDQSHAGWYFRNIEESTNNLRRVILNWSNFIYPLVKNKIIVDYDYYVNNSDLLLNDLGNFLGISLDLPNMSEVVSLSTPVDVSYTESRRLYTNTKLDAYKEGLSIEETDYIFNNMNFLDVFIKYLISKQQKN